MENTGILESIITFIQNINWTEVVVVWFSLEKGLKILAKITPWDWDDDLIEWVSKTVGSLVKKKQ